MSDKDMPVRRILWTLCSRARSRTDVKSGGWYFLERYMPWKSFAEAVTAIYAALSAGGIGERVAGQQGMGAGRQHI